MSFRTVVIRTRCKLEYSLNYLIYRGEEEKHLCLDEINTLIIENQQVALTAALLSKLAEKKIKVIFCDAKHNPQFEMIPYYANYETYTRIIEQMSFSKEAKETVWARIIKRKIESEVWVLKRHDHSEEALLLERYVEEVEPGDASNREGHAAKVYFNALFGKDFSRDSDCVTNIFLNYGYSMIVSALNREIKNIGYLTEVGIHHIGNTNPFNLTYDLFEPLRCMIDEYVASKLVTLDDYRDVFKRIFDAKVSYRGARMYLENAIPLYVRSLLKAVKTNDPLSICFIDYEF